MSKIIGIRYIGKKPTKGDTIFNTGAVWKPYQVNNFAETMAKRLLQHTDSFEEADVSVDGDTFMGSKTGRKEAPVSVYANLSNMDAAQLSLFAKRELNRTVDIEGRDIDAVRAEVHRLMVTSNMDEIANEAGVDLNEGSPYTIRVSMAELEALMSGQIVVKLVPTEVADEDPAGKPNPELSDEERATLAQAEAENAGNKEEPTLDELLASLETKDELLAFAIQENIPGLTGRNSVETMRSTISEAIKARVAGNADA